MIVGPVTDSAPCTLESSRDEVLKLICDFEAHRDAYVAPAYGESQLRTDFIDKLFSALGWDVTHQRQKNPFEQEVKVEKRVVENHARRRADYAFHLAPNFRDPRFYVEAKRPGVELATSDNYFQTIRYGWNSQTPVVVLTNFREVHVLDSRYRPNIATALDQRLAVYTLEDLRDDEKFAELYYLLSREAVAVGSLEKFAASRPTRGTKARAKASDTVPQRIDRAFLAELDEHREALAKSFKRSNPRLDGEALTEITQRVLDRLIFMRFLEDKLIEQDEMIAAFARCDTPWTAFESSSRRLDRVYNGIVFKQHPILDSAGFRVDQKMFANLCRSLTPAASPYDFNAIPIHILGSIYERFLGKVIVVEGREARLEARPEIRKAGGIYYTPEHVVRLLVNETVGHVVKGKSPQQISSLRFCDVACGSGSFLLGVFERLLVAHGQWYNANPARAKREGCVRDESGSYRLSLAQKRKLLHSCIFGVDLDPQAVEVAQLSLYLKLLEDETTASAHSHQLEFRETLLPPLDRNILCGNTVIRTDILENTNIPRDELLALRPMDIEDQFPGVMRAGGFDVIVGNPPYVRPHNLDSTQKTYFWTHYSAFKGKADLYACFMQRTTALLRPGGYLGYIVARGWLALDSFDVLRQHILASYKVHQLIELPARVFAEAQVETIVLIFQREDNARARERHTLAVGTLEDDQVRPVRSIPQRAFASTHGNVFDLSIEPATEAIKSLMREGPTLGSLYDVVFGLKTGDDSKFLHRQAGRYKDDRLLLRGEDVHRYGHTWNGEYVWYVPEKMRAHRKTARPGERARFEQPKVLVKDTTKELGATWEDGNYYVKDVLIVLPRPDTPAYDLKALLGILNSQALRFYYRTTFPTLHVQNKELASLPLPNLDLSARPDRAAHDRLIALVDQRLDLETRRRVAPTDAARQQFETRIRTLERRIDELVSTLYGLDAAAVQTLTAAVTRSSS